ncbi:MAG: alanine racemase C-terminal domain-containing protein [Aquificota bacterium]|nr:alanine racemase C-terminal domain-containing protein [Aquificota bacterium]
MLTRIVSVKEVPKGHPAIPLRGRALAAAEPMRIGVVAFGYADGLMKSLSNRGYLLYRNSKLPILGNITMDMTVIGLEGARAKVGDWVTVVGKGEDLSA